MGLAQTKPFYTVENYLEIDRTSDERYEYLDGEIWLMAGETDAHGDISFNLAGLFHDQLKDTPCRGRVKDTKVRSGAIAKQSRSTKGMFSYPDIVIICGAPQYLDDRRDVVLNPQVIVEVLSESTESFDRGEKFMRFTNWNPTLTDYILVSQDKPVIEHFVRGTNGSWILSRYIGLQAECQVESIKCSFKLSDVFDRVEFPPEAEEFLENF